MKQMLFEAKFDQYSKYKKFRELDGAEYLLRSKVDKFVDFNIGMQVFIKLNSDTQDLFSSEGLSFKDVSK